MTVKQIGLGVGGAVLLAIGVFFGVLNRQPDPSVPTTTVATPAAAQPAPAAIPAGLAIEPGDRVLGNRDAAVQIIEYASLTCPHCANFKLNVFPQVKAAWVDTGRVRYVYRDFPLDQVALQAALVARCAPEDRAFPLLEALFQTQGQWATASDPVAAIRRIGRLAGLSDERISECLADQALQTQVLQQRLTGSQVFNVQATPTILINGQQVRDSSFAGIDQALRQIVR
jgi:protein-disulfide isomerase